MKRLFRTDIISTFLATLILSSVSFAQTTTQLLNELRKVETGDESTQKASQLVAKLKSSKDLRLMQALEAMKGATPIGRNWLLGVANARYRIEKDSLENDLTKFLSDTEQDSEARYRAFVWLTNGKPELRNKLLATMQNDPSPELRYAAIALAITEEASTDTLKTLLESARHPNQVVDLINRLEKREVKVSQQKFFGFLPTWNLIGPFDHVGSKNFDKVFPVEADWIKGSAQESYEGKKDTVKWIEYSTEEKDGNIDLAAIFNKEKGCIVYAMTEYNSPIEGPAEIRMGCINAHKIWLNGELVMSNEVYHSSSLIDQYIEPIKLKKGPNRILIKICQNEQTEPWAQRYQFLVRICDSTGKAILAATQSN